MVGRGVLMLMVFGGIGLFLLGMTMLTNGLKEIAGDALKKWLNTFTKGTFSAIFSGAAMTLIVQSSTATTLLTIGFVSAGLITFTQSIGVIIGANIGSTSTGLLISLVGFKVSFQVLSLPIIGLGVFIALLASNHFKKFGNVLTGFGLLFLGIDMLQNGMSNVQNLISFENIEVDSFFGILLLIVIGLIMTVIMQASSAAMAATLAALFTGAIDFEQAAYLVIGQNIGTTATALFASIGASIAAKRTAMTHLLFNLITAFIVTIIFPYFLKFSKWVTVLLTGKFDEPLGLAIFHILFSVLGMLLFLPVIKKFAILLEKLIPERVNSLTRNLDGRLVEDPTVAVEVLNKTIHEIVAELFSMAHSLFTAKKITVEMEKKLQDIEEAIDIIRKFMNNIHTTSSKSRNKLIVILHSLDHLSRLIKVMREQMKIDVLYEQESLAKQWVDTLTEINEIVTQQDRIKDISLILEKTSQNMAEERKNRRKLYFEHTIDNDSEVEMAVFKIEGLLWLDRLIFHFWRATARMAELQGMNDEK